MKGLHMHSLAAVETLDLRVTRKVVKVTPENVEDGSLERLLESYKIIARKSDYMRVPESYDPETGTYETTRGVEYYEAHKSYPERHCAAISDYIVIIGNGDAYTLTPAELITKDPVTSSGTENREPKLARDSKVWVCHPQNRKWFDEGELFPYAWNS